MTKKISLFETVTHKDRIETVFYEEDKNERVVFRFIKPRKRSAKREMEINKVGFADDSYTESGRLPHDQRELSRLRKKANGQTPRETFSRFLCGTIKFDTIYY